MISKAQQSALQRLAAKRGKAELKALFALIRKHDDKALLAALAKRKPQTKRQGDPLVRDTEQILRPLMAPSAEKAELLVEHLAPRRKINPRGLADAVKKLRAAKLSDARIRAGAKSLMAELSGSMTGARRWSEL